MMKKFIIAYVMLLVVLGIVSYVDAHAFSYKCENGMPLSEWVKTVDISKAETTRAINHGYHIAIEGQTWLIFKEVNVITSKRLCVVPFNTTMKRELLPDMFSLHDSDLAIDYKYTKLVTTYKRITLKIGVDKKLKTKVKIQYTWRW
jgi:hypothetical protein